jgi:hypothetical protein
MKATHLKINNVHTGMRKYIGRQEKYHREKRTSYTKVAEKKIIISMNRIEGRHALTEK